MAEIKQRREHPAEPAPDSGDEGRWDLEFAGRSSIVPDRSGE
jgi:hypothetical protein